MNVHFYSRQQSIKFLKQSKEFQDYYYSFHPDTIYTKIGVNTNSIEDFYNKCVSFDPLIKNKIRGALRQLPETYSAISIWKFICLETGTEKNWPFTIENAILVTPFFIQNVSLTSLSETLAHEHIHNLQWKYPMAFSNFYQSLGFKEIGFSGINKIVHYSNPDGLQLPNRSWALNYKDNVYLPLMVYKNKSIKKKLYKLSKLHNKYVLDGNSESYKCEKALNSVLPEAELSQCYHPHEMLADLGSRYIVNGSSGNKKVDIFLDSLNTL